MSTRVTYRRIRPSLDLAGLVDFYWAVTPATPLPPEARQVVLPDGYTDLIFSIADEPAGGRAELRAMGLHTGAIEVPAARPLTLGVSFRPGRARALLAPPAGELTDRIVPAEALLGRAARSLLEALGDASSIPARVALLEAFLRERARPDPVDALAAAAGDAILARRGQVDLDALARAAGLGPRQLRRRFARAVGLGPKRFARVVRFSALTELVHRQVDHPSGQVDPSAVEWASLALEHGYCDQAHMIREFKRMAGVSPARHLRRRRS